MVGCFRWNDGDALELKNTGKNITFSNLNIHDRTKENFDSFFEEWNKLYL